MRISRLMPVFVVSVGAIVAPRTFAQPTLTTELVASDLARPVFVAHPPGDATRLFILEQHTGRIRILDVAAGVLLDTAYLTISDLSTGNEQGLLGLAFHPQYRTNGLTYVYYTDASGTSRVVSHIVSDDPNQADPLTAVDVIRVAQPQPNHNAGWIAFGPDELLYIATGDGGASNDTGTGHTVETGNAQDITDNLLGKILRFDVDGDDFPGDDTRNYAVPTGNPFVGRDGDDEIWVYGLRNPWRCSFDAATDDLYIADVGQNAWEEVNVYPAGSPGGDNFGWRCMEGLHCTGLTGCTCNDPALVMPVHEYSHAEGCSVTGGYVYRGAAIPHLRGTYFFADFCSATIWSFRYTGAGIEGFTDRTAELAPGGGLDIGGISSFGVDETGEIYICDMFGGEVFRIVPRCRADMNGDGQITSQDFTAFLNLFGADDPAADYNDDGGIDSRDFVAFLNDFVAGC